MLPGIASHPVRRSRGPALLLLAAACLGLGGCGLGSYEAQMASEQLRVSRFDDENEYLGAPLEIPKPKDPKDPKGEKELDQPPVFLRPPKGIGPKPDKNLGPGSFLHYTRDGQRATGKGADRLVYTDVYVWIAPAEQKDFAGSAYRAFAAQLEGIRPDRVTEYPLKRQARQQDTERATEQLVFDPAYRSTASGGGLSLFVCQRNGANVAIAYQLDKGRTAPMFKRLGEDGTPVSLSVTDLSLESLGVDREARLLREAYDLRKRH